MPFFLATPVVEPFNWLRLLWGDEAPWTYLFEVIFRTVVMYTTMLVFFKITGKKGIKQLSLFDFILIIGLGSAAGDPMFYHDVPLLHALLVFATILVIYLAINKITQRSHRLDVYLEGKTTCVFRDGRILYDVLMKEGLTTMQFHGELRQRSVAHLGQVRRVYLESSGEPSVYYLPDEAVRPGLPLFPEQLDTAQRQIAEPGFYSCVQCGQTEQFAAPVRQPVCKACQCPKFVASIEEKRVP